MNTVVLTSIYCYRSSVSVVSVFWTHVCNVKADRMKVLSVRHVTQTCCFMGWEIPKERKAWYGKRHHRFCELRRLRGVRLTTRERPERLISFFFSFLEKGGCVSENVCRTHTSRSSPWGRPSVNMVGHTVVSSSPGLEQCTEVSEDH